MELDRAGTQGYSNLRILRLKPASCCYSQSTPIGKLLANLAAHRLPAQPGPYALLCASPGFRRASARCQVLSGEQPHCQRAIGQQADPLLMAALRQAGVKGAAQQAVGVLEGDHRREGGVCSSCSTAKVVGGAGAWGRGGSEHCCQGVEIADRQVVWLPC
jgi:hypothetical protein